MAIKNIWEAVKTGVKKVWHNTSARIALWGVLFFLIFTALLSADLLPTLETLEEGQVAPKDFVSPVTMEYEDTAQTEQKREEAANNVPPYYSLDSGVTDWVKTGIGQFFARIQETIGEEEILAKGVAQEKADQIRKDLGVAITPETIAGLLMTNKETLGILKEQVVAVTGELLSFPGVAQQVKEKEGGNTPRSWIGILPMTMAEARDQVLTRLDKTNFTQGQKAYLQEIILAYLRPNAFYDAAATRQRVEEARAKVTPVKILIKQNEMILRQGDKVEARHIELLTQLGLLRSKTSWLKPIGMGFLSLITGFLLVAFLYHYRRDMLKNENLLVLIGILMSLTLLSARLISTLSYAQWPVFSAMNGYLVPLAAASMSLAILLDTKVAIFVTILLSLLVGIIAGNNLSFAIVALVGGLVGIYSISKVSQRSDIARAGFHVAAANMITIFTLELINNSGLMTGASWDLLVSLLIGLGNGVLSSVLMIGSLPYLESGFGVTTSIRLLELSNPNQPLLKMLLTEAPGTYHHSILVGNLAERAADAIGADSLLVRVGSYYHDVGKARRPAFFIENQMSIENPHDKIAPSLSTLIITSHVKDGGEMAREHKLPPPVIEILEQHHGTGLVSYFYHKAAENDRTESVNQEDFRYEGPKPQTREAAIVMLADTVEAAVRSMDKPTPGRIEGMVRKLIKEKLQDGQLDECDLTFKDLDTIAVAFVQVLSGIFHSRIEYPDNMVKELERRRAKSGLYRKQ